MPGRVSHYSTSLTTDDVKRTAAGKMAAANHAQSAQNLKPLFRLLRNRVSMLWKVISHC